MSKELEALKNIRIVLEDEFDYHDDIDTIKSALERKEKLEKLVKLIKNKIVNFRYILNDNLTFEDYNKAYPLASRSLEKDEFDFIRKVLKDEKI